MSIIESFLDQVKKNTNGFVVLTESGEVLHTAVTLKSLVRWLDLNASDDIAYYINSFGKVAKSAYKALNWNNISYKHYDKAGIQDLIDKYTGSLPWESRKPILILGHARHGKDTAAEYIRNKYSYNFQGSSLVFARLAYETMGYESAQECFEDRHNNRELWHKMIAQYCHKDPARLGKLIYRNNEIYCGIRAQKELDAVIAEFKPAVIWIDALDRLDPESDSSFKITKPPGAITISNNNEDPTEMFAQIDTLFSLSI